MKWKCEECYVGEIDWHPCILVVEDECAFPPAFCPFNEELTASWEEVKNDEA